MSASEHAPQDDLIDAVDNLTSLRSRVNFVLISLTKPGDWIDDGAAQALYFSLEGVSDEMAKVINTIDIARGAACQGGEA